MSEDIEIAVGIDVLKPGAKYGSCRSFQELLNTWDNRPQPEGNGEPCPPEATIRAAGQAQIAVHTNDTALTTYAKSHKAQRRKFLNALYQFEQTINLHTPTGANLLPDYQAVLTAAMNIVNTLPQAYIDNLNAERDLQALAIAVNTMTLAQCRTFAIMLRAWLNTRCIMADTATEFSLNSA